MKKPSGEYTLLWCECGWVAPELNIGMANKCPNCGLELYYWGFNIKDLVEIFNSLSRFAVRIYGRQHEYERRERQELDRLAKKYEAKAINPLDYQDLID